MPLARSGLIRLNELAVDTANRTYGRGMVHAGDELYLSPNCVPGPSPFGGGRKDLEFEGGAQMQFECDDFDNEWVEFGGHQPAGCGHSD